MLGVLAINERFFIQKQHHVVFFTILAEIAGGKEWIVHPDEIGEIAWKTIDEADSLMPYYKGMLRQLIHSQVTIPYFDQGAK